MQSLMFHNDGTVSILWDGFAPSPEPLPGVFYISWGDGLEEIVYKLEQGSYYLAEPSLIPLENDCFTLHFGNGWTPLVLKNNPVVDESLFLIVSGEDWEQVQNNFYFNRRKAVLFRSEQEEEGIQIVGTVDIGGGPHSA
jgi:hypothetical protein